MPIAGASEDRTGPSKRPRPPIRRTTHLAAAEQKREAQGVVLWKPTGFCSDPEGPEALLHQKRVRRRDRHVAACCVCC
jgi:hypothetical protein